MGKFKDLHTKGHRAGKPSRLFPTGRECTSDTAARGSRKRRVKYVDRRAFVRLLKRAKDAGAKQEQWDARDIAHRKRLVGVVADADTFTVLNEGRIEGRNRASLSLPPKVFHWNMTARSSSPCEAPWHVYTLAGFEPEMVARFPNPTKFPTGRLTDRCVGLIKLYARCRKCPGCLKARKNLWIARARAEVKLTPGRLWFCTVTAKPETRELVDAAATYLALRRRKQPSSLTEGEYRRLKSEAFYREIQLYLKRLRKGYGRRLPGRFRFLCVIEPHKDGNPHAHLLFHEQVANCLQERAFRHHGRRIGFVKANLAEADSGVEPYLAKLGDYITKDASMYVRSSVRYGRGLVDPRTPESRSPDCRERVARRAKAALAEDAPSRGGADCPTSNP